MSVQQPPAALETNPYERHPQLTETEGEVLWQYARLAQNVKDLVAETRRLSQAPDETMLESLRILEGKMGLVMTLFKASVWSFINKQAVSESSGAYDETGTVANDNDGNDTTIRQ